jgi:hypothetical protein
MNATARSGILAAVTGPRVDRLSFTFHSLDDRHEFSRAAAWEGELGGFRCRLHEGTLEAQPRANYADVRTALLALEPQLRTWELWIELESNLRTEFRYASAQIVDTQSTPSTPGSGGIDLHVQFAESGQAVDNIILTVGHSEYPPPPPRQLAISPLVEELLGWVRDLREGRQRMLVLAYLFVTRLTYEYNSEAAAAGALKVSRQVLVTLRKLAAKNDPSERRKVAGPIQRLTDAERYWITAALPRVTRQVAEIEAGSSPPTLTMGPPDLPRL